MDYNNIKQLIQDMDNSTLSELNINFPDGTNINLKRNNNFIKKSECEKDIKEVSCSENIVNNDEDIYIVKSPIVGTFYSKASPTAEPFVKVGQKVKKGDKLCIIEAMKLMNEIETENTGEVIEILLKDEDIVQYGSPMFKIKINN